MVVLVPKEIASILRCSERHATRLLKSGEIEGFRVGRKLWCATDLHVEQYILRKIQEEREKRATLHRLSTAQPSHGLSVTGRELPPGSSLFSLPATPKRRLA